MNEYKYKTAVDLRRALEARLKDEAESTGSDYGRLRRIVVFDRIAARLSASEEGWVLKGGTALEFRLGLRARATKDLDLVLRSAPPERAAIRDILIETLAADVDRDRFVFTVGHPIELDTDAAGNPGMAILGRRRASGQDLHRDPGGCGAPPRRTRGDGTHLASRQARIRGNTAAHHRVRRPHASTSRKSCTR